MIERGRKESLRRKLVNPTRETMNDISHQIIELRENFPKELLETFIQKIENGFYPDKSVLIKLVVSLRNKELYEASKSVLINGVWDKIELLKADIPDPEIEQRLTNSLIDYFVDDFVIRKEIVECLRDYGSIECLDSLYGLEFDYDPKYKTDIAIQKGLEKLDIEIDFDDVESLTDEEKRTLVRRGADKLIRDVDITFGKLLKDSIKVISQRNKTSKQDWRTQNDLNSVYLKSYNYSLIKAKEKYRDDFKGALNATRQSLEALLKHIVYENGLKPKAQIDNLQIENLVQILRDAKLDIPRPIFTQIELVQKQSTIGSHDQGSILHEDIFTSQMILGIIEALEKINENLKDLT